MKLLILIAALLSAVLAKQAETKAEKFECMAIYLKDKKLLESDFQFSLNSQQLECEAAITELKEKILREKLKIPYSIDESEDTKASRKLIQDNSACITGDLTVSGYPDIMMKLSIYEVSRNLNMKQRKVLTASTKLAGNKLMQTAILKCVTGPTLSEMFDNIMKGEDEQAIDEQQINYCVRKHVVDKNLVNANEFTVTLNPKNIELNFNCEDRIKNAIEALEETVKQIYKGVYETESQLQCLTKVIIAGRGLDYVAKIFVLSEVQLTDDQKEHFRSEFLESFRALNDEMIKCI